jgi:hypothetical protein
VPAQIPWTVCLHLWAVPAHREERRAEKPKLPKLTEQRFGAPLVITLLLRPCPDILSPLNRLDHGSEIADLQDKTSQLLGLFPPGMGYNATCLRKRKKENSFLGAEDVASGALAEHV